MKRNATLLWSFALIGPVAAAAQDQPETQGPPPIAVERDRPAAKEPVPTPDKYPLGEAIRRLESGDENPLPPRTPVLPSISNGSGHKASGEVPRDFVAKRDVVLNSTGIDAMVISREWETRHNEPAVGSDGRVVYTYGAGLPVVVCAPLHVCLVELEVGEKLIGEPHIGDSVRWEISPSVSGNGPDATPILIIKPRIAGLDTTMVVPTDRRAYYLRLESKPNEYLARVAFTYPEETRREWELYLARQREEEEQEKAARIADLPAGAMDRMYWNYEIKGGTASTRPVHVIDDGEKTYIQMPEDTMHRELPVLVVKGRAGPEMVNYRVKDNMYIVDRLFDRATLLLGTGRHQTKVEVIRKDEANGRKSEPVKLPALEPRAAPPGDQR
jgi:type IV secretion system protein TrbG